MIYVFLWDAQYGFLQPIIICFTVVETDKVGSSIHSLPKKSACRCVLEQDAEP